MSKFDGALDTIWRGNLSHPISADTCDAQFQRAPERHPGSLRCKSLLMGQVLFQVRIRPEIAFLENGAGQDRSCVTAQRLVLSIPVDRSPSSHYFPTRATGRRKLLLNSFTRQPSRLHSTPADLVVMYGGLTEGHVTSVLRLGRCYTRPSTRW
jgi:hypothetical protein